MSQYTFRTVLFTKGQILMIDDKAKLNMPNFPSTFHAFIMLLIPIGLITLITFSFFYMKNVNTDIHLIKQNELQIIHKQQSLVLKTLQDVVADLMVTASHNEIRDMFNENKINFSNTAEQFTELVEYKKKYDQVRYIDEKGKERVRVNYSGGKAYIVPEESLQNKAERYYFKDTIKLQKGEVFMSPLDLNIENGVVEMPYKPMIRFGTPIYDSDKVKRGIIIVNYLGQELINSLMSFSDTTYGSILMINQNGDWIKGPTLESDWSFMFPDKLTDTFSNEHSKAWVQIADKAQGQIIISDNIFTFDTVYPLEIGVKASKGSPVATGDSTGFVNERDFSWKLISHVPAKVLSEVRISNLYKLLPFLMITVFMIVIGCYFLARNIVKRQAMARELLDYNKELEARVQERTAQLKSLNAELEQKVEDETQKRLHNENLLHQQIRFIEIGQMFTAIAHHWRQPLNIIGLRIQDIADEFEEGSLDKEYIDDFIEFNMTQIKKMSYSIDNFRSYFSTSDEAEDFDIVKIIKETVGLLDGQLTSDQITFYFSCDCEESVCSSKTSEDIKCHSGAASVYGYKQLFKQVVLHIMINAYDAIVRNRGKTKDAKGKLSVRIDVGDKMVNTIISDTGGGVPEKIKNKIYDPYFTTKDEGEGTGMGLYMSKVIVEKNLNGMISYKNSFEGADFIISIPKKFKSESD